MKTLRTHLGVHEGAGPNELCLVELSSLVMRACRVAKLRVRMEVPVQCYVGTEHKTGEMDCGWFSTGGQWLVAWEFDGRNVRPEHIAGDAKRIGNVQKFGVSTALLKVQVLYALRNDMTHWGASQAERCRKLLGTGVRVITDEQLMAPNGIEGYINEARSLAGLPSLD